MRGKSRISGNIYAKNVEEAYAKIEAELKRFFGKVPHQLHFIEGQAHDIAGEGYSFTFTASEMPINKETGEPYEVDEWGDPVIVNPPIAKMREECQCQQHGSIVKLVRRSVGTASTTSDSSSRETSITSQEG